MTETRPETPISLSEALSTLKDPRSKRRREHELVPILLMTVSAMICGATSLYAVAQWGRERREDAPQLLVVLGLKPGRSPSHPTLHRVFKELDVASFERLLGDWLRQVGRKREGPELLALDGKSLRGIHGEELPGVHLVAAYSLETDVVLAQRSGEGKGQELTTVKELLAGLPLERTVVMGDALQTQREVCQTILNKGGTTSSS